MKRYLFATALLLVSLTGNAELKIGDMAPDFQLEGSDGQTYSLAQFKGESPVVIAFFPKVFTGG